MSLSPLKVVSRPGLRKSSRSGRGKSRWLGFCVQPPEPPGNQQDAEGTWAPKGREWLLWRPEPHLHPRAPQSCGPSVPWTGLSTSEAAPSCEGLWPPRFCSAAGTATGGHLTTALVTWGPFTRGRASFRFDKGLALKFLFLYCKKIKKHKILPVSSTLLRE